MMGFNPYNNFDKTIITKMFKGLEINCVNNEMNKL